jgi:hypothetical protein
VSDRTNDRVLVLVYSHDFSHRRGIDHRNHTVNPEMAISQLQDNSPFADVKKNKKKFKKKRSENRI